MLYYRQRVGHIRTCAWKYDLVDDYKVFHIVLVPLFYPIFYVYGCRFVPAITNWLSSTAARFPGSQSLTQPSSTEHNVQDIDNTFHCSLEHFVRNTLLIWSDTLLLTASSLVLSPSRLEAKHVLHLRTYYTEFVTSLSC